MGSFFKKFDEKLDEYEAMIDEEQEAKWGEKRKKENDEKIKEVTKEVKALMGSDEEVLFVHKFWNDKMIATNKKLIYIDLKIAKNKTFAMIPFNRITSYALTMPTGLAVKTKLKIFTGGDRPSIEIEAAFDEGMKGFCKVLAEHI